VESLYNNNNEISTNKYLDNNYTAVSDATGLTPAASLTDKQNGLVQERTNNSTIVSEAFM